jgi:flagella basal body P-ring formation protein FlgA
MLFRFNLLFLLSIQPLILMGDVSRFLDPIRIKPSQVQPSFTINQKTTASIAPLYSKGRTLPEFSSSDREVKEVFLTREILEFKLGELLGYRYQASGKVVAYVTRQWTPIRLSSNFILKIRDCMPDNLSPSTFVRFTIWDHGSNIGEFAEPIRMSHFLNCLYTKNLSARGSKLLSQNFSDRPVDVLKQHAGAVPSGTDLKGYELAVNLRDNSILKWNHLTKVALVKKGEIVDVFASGNGIYISMKGMALENGVEGGIVKVRNLSSEKEFQAKVLNEKSVKVQL